MGGTIGRMVLGEQHAHRTDSIVQTRCQEKREPPPTLRKPMGVRVVALPFVWEVRMRYQVLIYHKGGGDYNPAPAICSEDVVEAVAVKYDA